jgi:hypothetical protein
LKVRLYLQELNTDDLACPRFTGVSEREKTINLVIYDMSGKLYNRHAINPMDVDNEKFGSNLASGMYRIEVRQGSNQALIRQVKN